MFVKELQKVTELDQQIMALQEQLIELYGTRSSLLTSGTKKAPLPPQQSHETYQSLLKAWQKYDIKLPSYAKLKDQLEAAHELLDNWAQKQSQLRDNMAIILVPPARMIGIPAYSTLRSMQGFMAGGDIITESVKLPKKTQTWRILLAYTGTSGIYLGLGDEVFSEKSYLIGGHDTRGLGLQEYIALTLQLNYPVDVTTWTSLLKSTDKDSNAIIYAGCRARHYRFSTNDMFGMIEDDRFRPAIEVTAKASV